MSALDNALRLNIRVAVSFARQDLEERTPDYPLAAVQQIVRNAILHRTYENTNAPVRIYWFSDRVEVHSAGGPYGQVNRANFGQLGLCDYRNPNLAAVMKELGYVQRFGMGLPLARRAMEENGNPPPQFHVEEGHVVVVLEHRR
jgi:ATP-dependent DNA helicase RecG